MQYLFTAVVIKIETATFFANRDAGENSFNNLRIAGIDLAGMFREYPADLALLQFLEIPIEEFKPSQEFDLITCVHGLHYLGDKLPVIQKAASWLKKDRVFLANLEIRNPVRGLYQSAVIFVRHRN